MKKYLLVLFLIFISCSKEKIEPYSLSYDTVKIDEVSFTNEEYELEKYVDFKGSNPLPKYLLDSDYKMKDQISYKEYKEDIIVLFHILKSRYSLYQEFGGDKVFNDLKEKALKKFENEKSIKTKDIVKYLLEDLFVNKINDLHFSIDNKHVNAPRFRTYLYKPYIENIKDIKSINGDTDLSKYIVKTLDENGSLKNTIKINSPFEKFYKPVIVEYKDGKKETLDLKLISSIGYPRTDKVEIHKNYAYVRFTSFKHDIRKEYVDKLDKIKNKDLILDLRNNSGGYTSLIYPMLN